MESLKEPEDRPMTDKECLEIANIVFAATANANKSYQGIMHYAIEQADYIKDQNYRIDLYELYAHVLEKAGVSTTISAFSVMCNRLGLPTYTQRFCKKGKYYRNQYKFFNRHTADNMRKIQTYYQDLCAKYKCYING